MINNRTEFAQALLAYGTETMVQESFHQMEAKFGEVMRIYDEQMREAERHALERVLNLSDTHVTNARLLDAIRALIEQSAKEKQG